MQLQPDTLLQGRYRVVALIAQGGMGAVYRAVDERLGHTVALKQTLMADPALRAAFEREARLLAGLHHPALPVVSDHFSEQGGQFLVMQYIPGDDLAALLRARGAPFAAAQALTWADEVLDALDFLHTRRPPVIHRDIKPQNLKLAPHGGVVLLDFGLAKGLGGGVSTASPSLFGYTPQYASLEQIQGVGTDARSDLYSLAATLAELLSGQAPPDALTRAAASVRGDPDPLQAALGEAIPPPVAALLAQALALNPAQRPPSAAAMRDALRAAATAPAPDPAGARPTHAPQTLAGSPYAAPEQTPRPPAALPAAPHAVTGPTVALPRPDRRRAPLPLALLLIGALTILVLAIALSLWSTSGAVTGGALGVTEAAYTGDFPAATAVAAAAATSFADPLAYGQTGAYGPWQLVVLGSKRGREAWSAMYEANQFNDPPPDGYEYLLVRLALEATADAPALYPRLAGERRVLYAPVGVSPSPLPEGLGAGQRVEAWAPYLVAVDEDELVLHVDSVYADPQPVPLFMAVEEGARHRLDPTLAELVPDELGLRHGEPAPLGATAVAEDYAVTVLEARRGPRVLDELAANFAGVERPRPGYEYALVRLRVRYLGGGGAVGWSQVGPSDFGSVGTDAANPEAETIAHPRVYVLPDALRPLDAALLPGGEVEGWTVVELPVEVETVALVFSPSFDFNGLNTRYFALK